MNDETEKSPDSYLIQATIIPDPCDDTGKSREQFLTELAEMQRAFQPGMLSIGASNAPDTPPDWVCIPAGQCNISPTGLMQAYHVAEDGMSIKHVTVVDGVRTEETEHLDEDYRITRIKRALSASGRGEVEQD